MVMFYEWKGEFCFDMSPKGWRILLRERRFAPLSQVFCIKADLQLVDFTIALAHVF